MKTSKIKVAVIIAAAGEGRRLGADCPKQFIRLEGKAVLAYTLEVFEAHPQVGPVVVVVSREALPWAQASFGPRGGFAKVKAVVAGGDSRQASVAQGLEALADWPGMILIHDGARPMVSPQVIDRVIQGVQEHGAAIAAVPLADTLKRADAQGQVLETPARDHLWQIQTPQGFEGPLLRKAYAQGGQKEGITDDAMLVEALGHPVFLVLGETTNQKVTYPEDLQRFQQWLRAQGVQKEPQMRIGMGYDVHRLVADRPLILGGITVPWEKGLLGHSDADVLTHAVMDALLGAAGLGDIGRHFPDTDPQYKDISSLELLRQVRDKLVAKGWRCSNLDATIMAEAPRLAPYLLAMEEELAGILGLDAHQVNLKATTWEGLSFVGQGQGMAAQAVAMIIRDKDNAKEA